MFTVLEYSKLMSGLFQFLDTICSFNIFMQENDVVWEKCLEDPITSMDDFVGWLEFIRNGKTQSSESEKLSTKRLPVEKTTGSFNEIPEDSNL